MRALTGFAFFVAACGGPAPGPTLIAEVGELDAGAGSDELDELAREDAELAAGILEKALAGDDPALAAWAAVYSLRLGIRRDEDAASEALALGATSKDPLLASLCWRWLAVRTAGGELPRWRQDAPEEPVLGAMISAAHLARGAAVPDALAHALGLPPSDAAGRAAPNPRAVAAIEASAAPYDDGPLAAAVSFAVARRDRWATKDGWWAVEARRALLDALGADGAVAARFVADLPWRGDPPPTRLTDRLDLAISSQPRELIRKVATRGTGPLRLDALRALAVTAPDPAAGDLGAAAAAMRSEDPVERLEAARTFLLLTARAAR
jgi:hypothetical protein